MPSKRKQINVRADPETEGRVRRLLPLVRQAVGLEVTISDLFRLGMIELERKYAGPPARPPKAAPAEHQPKKGK